MKKIIKFLGIIGLIVVICVLLFFVGTFLNNKIQLNRESKKIVSYGQKVTVDNKSMRVEISGKGKQTVVLLPGYLTGTPVLDFKPLTEELAKNYRVVVVEPFGYGLSEDTNKDRTVENLTSEIHQGLVQLGITHYTLMAHSISGVYALDYIKKYPKEVESFVGIDSSLPSQGGADDNQEGTIKFLSRSGIYRLFTKAAPELLNAPQLDQPSLDQFKFIALKNIGSEATMNEGREMARNFEKTSNLIYPPDLPILYFLASESIEPDEDWLPIHQKMIANSQYSEIKIYEGSHYLHHTKAEEMAADFTEFIAN